MIRTELVRYWVRYLLYLILLAFSLVTVHWTMENFGVPETAPTDILEPMLTAQASLFAIVLSLTVVGIQLIAPKYSPRLNWIFTENPRFYSAFTIVCLSLATVVGAIVLQDILTTYQAILLITVVVVGGAVSLHELYLFVRGGFVLTSPDGVIEEYRHRLAPSWYVARVWRTDTDREGTYHPLRGLAELVEETYKGDSANRQTARAGMQAYHYIIKNAETWYHADERRWMHLEINMSFFGRLRSRNQNTGQGQYRYRSERVPADNDTEVFKLPMRDHLPRMAVIAEEYASIARDPAVDRQLTTDCVRCLRRVNERAAAAGNSDAAAAANSGLRQTIELAIKAEASNAAGQAWKQGLEGVPELADSPEGAPIYAAEALKESLSLMEQVHGYGKGANRSDEVSDAIARRFFIYMYLQAIEGVCATEPVSELDTQTQVPTIDRNETTYPTATKEGYQGECLELATAVCDGTCRAIELCRFLEQSNESPAVTQQFRSTLTEVCQTVLETTPTPLASPLLQAFIEASFVFTENWSKDTRRWLESFQKLLAIDDETIPEQLNMFERKLSDTHAGEMTAILDIPNEPTALGRDGFADHIDLLQRVAASHGTDSD